MTRGRKELEFSQEEEESPLITLAFSKARKYFSDIPNPFDGADTILSHSLRVAKMVHNLPDSGRAVDREVLTVAAILYELPKYTSYTHAKISEEFGTDIFFLTYLSYDKPQKDFRETKMKKVRDVSYMGDIGVEMRLLWGINERDNLESRIKSYRRMKKPLRTNTFDVYFGRVQEGYRNTLWYYHLVENVLKEATALVPQWQEAATTFEEKLKQFEELIDFDGTHDSPEDETISIALRDTIYQISLASPALRQLHAVFIPSGRLAREDIEDTFGVGDIDVGLLSPDGTKISLNSEEASELPDLVISNLYALCQAHHIDWRGHFRIWTLNKAQRKLLIDTQPVASEPYLTDFDFGLADSYPSNTDEIYRRFVEYTRLLGNSSGKVAMSAHPVTNPHRTILHYAKRQFEDRTLRNPGHNLLVDSHLFLPYVFPHVLRMLEKQELLSNEGMRSLGAQALENKRAWMGKEIADKILAQTPRGKFKSQARANTFLRFLVDTLRESFGKTHRTSTLFEEKNVFPGFTALYSADARTKREVFDGLIHWYGPLRADKLQRGEVVFHKEDEPGELETPGQYSRFIETIFEDAKK